MAKARAIVLLGHLVVIGGGYLGVLRIAEWRGHSVWDATCAVDSWLPALPWTFFAYSTLYLYWPITVWLAPAGRRGIELCLYNFQAQLWASIASWTVFLLLPTKIHVREEMEQSLAASGEFIRGAFDQLYAVDSPWNAWPSLHVSLSLSMVLCWRQFVAESERFSPSKLMWIAMPCWFVLVLSILTTKQHFFHDIWTGAAVGLLLWCFYLRKRLAPRARTRDESAGLSHPTH